MSTITRAILTGQTDRPLIPANQSCQRYILLTLEMPNLRPQHRADRLPLNLSLIIDRSGSMSGNKLAYVKEAAIHTLKLLDEQDRVSIVIYDDEVEVLTPSTTLSADTRRKLISQVKEIRSGGMTCLSGGWFTGCDQIADHMTENHLNRALLLTDGLANRGMTDQEELVFQAKELRRRGITTTTFGVGTDFNQFLLQGIADAGGGHFYFIDQPQQIPNYFEGELGELLSTVARELVLEVSLPAGVELSTLNDTLTEQVGQKFRLLLGDAYAGETRKLVLQAQLPGSTLEKDIVLPLTLNYEDAQTRRGVTIENQSLQYKVVSREAAEAQVANEAVLKDAAHLEAEKAKMEALQKEYQGDVVGAQTALRRAGVHLFETMPAAAAPLVEDLEEIDQTMAAGLSEQARKDRHYRTYRRQRSRKDYKK